MFFFVWFVFSGNGIEKRFSAPLDLEDWTAARLENCGECRETEKRTADRIGRMRLRPGLTVETEEGADVATWRVELEFETENDGVQN